MLVGRGGRRCGNGARQIGMDVDLPIYPQCQARWWNGSDLIRSSMTNENDSGEATAEARKGSRGPAKVDLTSYPVIRRCLLLVGALSEFEGSAPGAARYCLA